MILYYDFSSGKIIKPRRAQVVQALERSCDGHKAEHESPDKNQGDWIRVRVGLLNPAKPPRGPV